MADPVLLLHSDTTDGSTTFTDSSPSGHTITVAGTVEHTTDYAKFGASSIELSASGRLNLPDSTDFELSGDFTIDFWLRPSGSKSVGFTNYKTTNRLHSLFMDSSTSGRVLVLGSNLITGISFTENVWQHYALVRSGSTITAYVDGVSAGTATNSDTLGHAENNFLFGSTLAVHYGTGHVDELRVIKEATWTSNFTPPTSKYGDSLTIPEISTEVDVGVTPQVGLLVPGAVLNLDGTVSGVNVSVIPTLLPIKIITSSVATTEIQTASVNAQFSFSADLQPSYAVIVGDIHLTWSAEMQGSFVGALVDAPATTIEMGANCSVEENAAAPAIKHELDIDLSTTIQFKTANSTIDFVASIDGVFVGKLILIEGMKVGVLLDPPTTEEAISLTPGSFQTGLLFLSPVTHFAIVPPAFNLGLLAVPPVVYTFTTEHADIYFLFVLTGAADGEEDVEVPISSFQARRRSGEPTYLQVVIPSLDAADDIAARPNGTMKVDMAYKIDGVWVQRETIIEADFEGLRVDEGIFSQSITLTGYKTLTPTAKTVTLTGATYRSTTDGKIRYRMAKPYIYLNPGDTVTIGSDTFTADVISYYYGATKTGVTQNMEIAES